jgi:PRTRC genetic system protein F
MMHALNLPLLASGIPCRLQPSATNRSTALLARRFYEAGVIPADVPARAAYEPLATAKKHLEQWVAKQIEGMQCLNLHLRLLMGKAHEEFSGEPAGAGMVTALWSSECEPFTVGAALEALEAMQTGLGQTVLTAIDHIGVLLIPAFTAWDAMGVAQEHYWYGEQNEEVALEEMCGDDETEREAMRDGMVTRKMIDEAFPAWATTWPKSRKTVSQRVLATVAESARSRKVRRVASLVLALKQLRLKDECRPKGDGWFIGFGPVLVWRNGDVLARIFDDFCNDACQAEYVDWCGEHRFDLEDESSVEAWMKLMKPRLDGIRLLDNLIFELSAGDWRRIPKGFT